MFDDAIIVQSAISAFNNAALYAPAFLWTGVLTLPLFILAWMFGDKLLGTVGWSRSDMIKRGSLWSVIIAFGWLVLFGGNYSVLRDDTSTLPFMIAAVVFVMAAFIGSNLQNNVLFQRKNLPYLALILIALGLSDMHVWWGPLLQIGVALFGFLLGRIARREMRAEPSLSLIILATTTTMLMQPEFFRFGQMGNLTGVHMIALMFVGILVAATIAVRNIAPATKIHDSAYVKLKWMMRFVVMLAVAVFVMTESVPVFLGAVAVAFMLFALSVWHASKTPNMLGDKLYAVTIFTFGVIISMPVISVIGIVLLSNMPRGNLWAESKYLL